jgi:hypothetical protein
MTHVYQYAANVSSGSFEPFLSFNFTITVSEAIEIARATVMGRATNEPAVLGRELQWTQSQEWYALFGNLDKADHNALLHPKHFYMICQAYLEKRLDLTGEWRRMQIIDDQNQTNEKDQTKAQENPEAQG